MIFDRRSSLKAHIKHLKDRCMKALNLLRVVGHMDWSADSETLLKLYRSQVRSKLGYGCVVYSSVRSSYMQPLDRVENAALRICLGAYRTPPSPAYMLMRTNCCLPYVGKTRSAIYDKP